ncbi:hypothetical protein QYM36_010233 [Artemia franciscana]|uniref:Uncharacterized protein n=1 Tax=Artemia franciscana TaxID=6661 RepID=A0AA88HWQ3_ARTSF|nr:hypothetical protein QYM36_010233 [Artemia franciscana]
MKGCAENNMGYFDVTDLECTEDVSLTYSSCLETKDMFKSVSVASAPMGLDISVQKTEVPSTDESESPLILNHCQPEIVEKFRLNHRY